MSVSKRCPEDELWLTGGPLDGSVLHWLSDENQEPQIQDMPVNWYKNLGSGWVHYELCWFMITTNNRKYAEPRLRYAGTVDESEVPEEFL